MKKYLSITLAAIAINVVYIFLIRELLKFSQCDGFGCVGSGILAMFALVTVMPIIFGIVIARSVKNPLGESNRKLGIVSAVIFFVIVLLMYSGSSLYQKKEWRAKCLEGQERTLTLYREHPEQFKIPPLTTPCE